MCDETEEDKLRVVIEMPDGDIDCEDQAFEYLASLYWLLQDRLSTPERISSPLDTLLERYIRHYFPAPGVEPDIDDNPRFLDGWIRIFTDTSMYIDDSRHTEVWSNWRKSPYAHQISQYLASDEYKRFVESWGAQS